MSTRFHALLGPVLGVPALVSILAPLPAHAAGSVRVSVSPNVLLADGVSTATVTAQVNNASGRPARDGTEVRFYTTAGNITQVAFTSAGVARATLTSSAVPQTANISVSAGIDQAVITVPMVSKLVEAAVGGRVMKIQGKYVAFSEDKRFIQADEQVRVNFRGVQIEANSVQVDIGRDTVKALGKVVISSDGKTLTGDRVWLDLKSFEGYITAVGTRKWFSAYGLTDLPERPKNLNPDFELVDLTDSRLLWVAKQANYIIDERVQVQGARAYVGGLKTIRMPFHESDLKVGFGETGQYIGFGSNGINLNVPIYLKMTPGSSTAFQVNYGAPAQGSLGYFSRTNGLSVDLVEKYGFAGASEGQASLTNMTDIDRWGFFWNHTQQVNKTTRLVTNLQFPEHKDLYGQMNLTTGLPVGTLNLAMAGAMPHRTGQLAKTFSYSFETKPKPLAGGKLAFSVETTGLARDAQDVRLTQGLRVPVPNDQYETIGFKVRPQPVGLGAGFVLDSSAALRAVAGNRNNGFGPAIETNIRKTLKNNGQLSFGLSYNHLATINDLIPTSGKLNANMNLGYQVTKRLRVAAMGTMALDAPSRNSILQASYQIAPGWRVDALHTLFKFGQYGGSDMQLGITRSIGSRDLSIYWSTQAHRWLIDFGAARF